MISNLVFCSLAGYALARMRFFGSGALFLVILATLMVPFQVVMVPTLLIVRGLGLVDTLPALMAPNLVTPFGVFLLRQFFKTHAGRDRGGGAHRRRRPPRHAGQGGAAVDARAARHRRHHDAAVDAGTTSSGR